MNLEPSQESAHGERLCFSATPAPAPFFPMRSQQGRDTDGQGIAGPWAGRFCLDLLPSIISGFPFLVVSGRLSCVFPFLETPLGLGVSWGVAEGQVARMQTLCDSIQPHTVLASSC